MASFVSTLTQPVAATPLSPAQPERPLKKRRQYHSCDPCRRGRRACDAHHAPSQACSNCTKTGKRCTFEWLRKFPEQRRKKRSSPAHEEPKIAGQLPLSHDEFSSLIWPADGQHTGLQEFHPKSGPMPLTDGLSNMHNSLIYSPPVMDHPSTSTASGPLFSQTTNEEDDERAVNSTTPLTNGKSAARPCTTNSASYGTYASKKRQAESTDASHRIVRQRRSISYRNPNRSQELNDQLSLTVNKSMIADSFVKFYTDSMECLLSCWVVQSACPYSMVNSALRPSTKAALNPDPTSYYKPRLRFHEMVCRLDSRLMPFSRSYSDAETLATRQALQKTIMAFASQCTLRSTSGDMQSRESRSKSGSPQDDSSKLGKSEENPIFGNPQSFDRLIQDSLWHDAYRSLQAISHVGSFCAIFAHIVFALTPQPVSATRMAANNSHPKRTSVSTSSSSGKSPSNSPPLQRKDSCNSDIVELMEGGGPPTLLETAIRHLHSWRRALAQASSSNDFGQSPPAGFPKRFQPSQTDIDGFSLLFWLGVMCDTTSAAVSNRPLIISDEDCIPAQSETSVLADSESPEDTGVWCLELHERTAKQHSDGAFSWPCSLAEAAVRLRDGTQMKVLLFRKAADLQSLRCRRVSPTKAEDAIQDALRVYDSFSASYGRFITDCIKDHSNLPARFQAWYIILGVHWHLGVLVLADAIESIDRSNKAEVIQKEIREHRGLLHNLRLSSANIVADLARASCSIHNPYSHHSLDQDFAFSDDGAFLVEPWADLLVRGVARATCVFLDLISASNAKDCHNFAEYATYCRNAEDCIAGLNQVAHKSDLAQLMATELTTRLRELTENDGSDEEQFSTEQHSTSNYFGAFGVSQIDDFGAGTSEQYTTASPDAGLFGFEPLSASTTLSDQEVIDTWAGFPMMEMGEPLLGNVV